jgi:hypothetical protein
MTLSFRTQRRSLVLSLGAMVSGSTAGCQPISRIPSPSADASAPTVDASAPDSVPDAEVVVESAAADGGACVKRADCEYLRLDFLQRMPNIRCPILSYCEKGTCHLSCTIDCYPGGPRYKPCPPGYFCDSRSDNYLCRYSPIACAEVSDCPTLPPSGVPSPNGGDLAWSCVNGECSYPGFTLDP